MNETPSFIPPSPPDVERHLLVALRAGDEAAFASFVKRHHSSLLWVAMGHVRDRAIAEEVVQDTWLAVIRGLDGFQRRSSLRTWIHRIAVNQAKARALRERRNGRLPSTDCNSRGADDDRFQGGRWLTPPSRWHIPEDAVLAKETAAHIEAAIRTLPPAQAQVISLRDIQGWSSEEVCDLLAITPVNQRVLLHRARSKVRKALEQHFATAAGT